MVHGDCAYKDTSPVILLWLESLNCSSSICGSAVADGMVEWLASDYFKLPIATDTRSNCTACCLGLLCRTAANECSAMNVNFTLYGTSPRCV